jgi:hypothetical protein
MARSSSRHQELSRRQSQDSKERFSSGHTRTPPSGSPSSGSASDDDYRVEMWLGFDTSTIRGTFLEIWRGTTLAIRAMLKWAGMKHDLVGLA